MSTPTYLGDGLYVDFDGYHVVLMAHDGLRTTHQIFLDPHVLAALNLYVENLATRNDEHTGQCGADCKGKHA